MHTGKDLDEVERLIDGVRSPIVILFDADNTLVRQGAGPDEFRSAVTAAVARFAVHPSVSRAIVLSNGAERGVPGMIHRGNKPWTSRRRLGIDRSDASVWVVGDQVLTDGVLAWRLGATFVHLVVDPSGEDAVQAIMRRIGRRMRRLFFLR